MLFILLILAEVCKLHKSNEYIFINAGGSFEHYSRYKWCIYIYNYTLDISGIHVPVSKKLGRRQKEELFFNLGQVREREREGE